MDRRHLLLALRRRQFQPFLQPIVGADGDWQGAEILMRWQHPHAGVLAPAVFLERLSEEGLLAATTRQMLQQVRTAWRSAPACLRQPSCCPSMPVVNNWPRRSWWRNARPCCAACHGRSCS
jgi:EAL domain-containing protein (putative c-di-GMP-specific phosphodiesterase class I)